MWITSRVPKLIRPFPSSGSAWEVDGDDNLKPSGVDTIVSNAWGSSQRSEMHPLEGQDAYWEADTNGDLMPREETA